MIIAVMSDLHDNVACWEIINRQLQQRRITTLINCGDTIAPSMLQYMAAMFDGDIHTVFGNNADRDLELKVVKTLLNVTHHGDRGGLEFHGQRIGFVHYPEVAEAMAASGEFDLVCHGHTHLKRWEPLDKLRAQRGEATPWILNPGTAGGMFEYPTFAVVDLATRHNEFIEVKL